jgi:hypothetical protein
MSLTFLIMQAHVCVEHFVHVACVSLQVHAFFTKPLFSVVSSYWKLWVSKAHNRTIMGEIWQIPKLHVESIWASNEEKETKLVDHQTEKATKAQVKRVYQCKIPMQNVLLGLIGHSTLLLLPMKLEWRMYNIYKCYLLEWGMISLSRILFQMCSKMLYVVCRDVDCWGSRRQVCNNESKILMMKWWWCIRDVDDDDDDESKRERILMLLGGVYGFQRLGRLLLLVGLGMSNFSFVCFVHCWSKSWRVI